PAEVDVSTLPPWDVALGAAYDVSTATPGPACVTDASPTFGRMASAVESANAPNLDADTLAVAMAASPGSLSGGLGVVGLAELPGLDAFLARAAASPHALSLVGAYDLDDGAQQLDAQAAPVGHGAKCGTAYVVQRNVGARLVWVLQVTFDT